MADYVETTDDNGGVHINSGIPNRAFVLAAKAIGGDSWSGAGRIWYDALTSGLAADSDFATFAAATVAAAGDHADAVRQDAWTTVGVTPGLVAPASGGPAPRGPRSSRWSARAASPGIRKQGTVDLDSDDPRAPAVRALVDRIDFAAVPRPSPSRTGSPTASATPRVECQVQEQALTADLHQLAALVLEE